jgi:hypothetical protein
MHAFSLLVEEGPNRGERLPLPIGQVAVVGRATDAQIRLPEDDKKVSRYQAVLEVRAAAVDVQDLNSRNGTFVNGERVSRGRLGAGDLLRVGRTSFRLVAADTSPAVSVSHGPAITEAEAEEGDLATVFPLVLPTVSMVSQPCSECGASLVGLQTSPWPDAAVLCDACAARIRSQGRAGHQPAELGGFEVLRFLNRGGMGSVYEGRQRGTAVRAALKVLSSDLPARHPLSRRFLREQQLHQRLVSERIVRCYAVSNVRADVCIAMEFVAGGDADRLAGRMSDMQLCVGLCADLFEGLAHGHEQGLVHRDVKPANLLLTLPDASGQIRGKLSDYGLAKRFQEAGGSTTATGLIAGSPLFVAPEQLLNFKRVETSADIYGAAASLYYLLTGSPAFPLAGNVEDAGVALICAAVLEGARVPLRTLRPEVPAQLAEWIDAMLLRDAVHRARVKAAEVAPWLRAFR